MNKNNIDIVDFLKSFINFKRKEQMKIIKELEKQRKAIKNDK